MYPEMFNRDEIFARLTFEKSDEVIEMIKKSKNPNFQDDLGLSYLHMACQIHYVDAVKALLESGADPNIVDKRGVSPVFRAIGSINNRNNEILELLLEYGLDLNRIEGGKTVKEQIESFHEDEMNKIINKYFKQ